MGIISIFLIYFQGSENQIQNFILYYLEINHQPEQVKKGSITAALSAYGYNFLSLGKKFFDRSYRKTISTGCRKIIQTALYLIKTLRLTGLIM